jgi:hypothetical protein
VLTARFAEHMQQCTAMVEAKRARAEAARTAAAAARDAAVAVGLSTGLPKALTKGKRTKGVSSAAAAAAADGGGGGGGGWGGVKGVTQAKLAKRKRTALMRDASHSLGSVPSAHPSAALLMTNGEGEGVCAGGAGATCNRLWLCFVRGHLCVSTAHSKTP